MPMLPESMAFNARSTPAMWPQGLYGHFPQGLQPWPAQCFYFCMAGQSRRAGPRLPGGPRVAFGRVRSVSAGFHTL